MSELICNTFKFTSVKDMPSQDSTGGQDAPCNHHGSECHQAHLCPTPGVSRPLMSDMLFRLCHCSPQHLAQSQHQAYKQPFRLVNQNPGLVLLFGLLLTKVRVELHTGMCCQSLHIAAEWPSIGPFDSSLGLLWASRPTQPHAHQV